MGAIPPTSTVIRPMSDPISSKPPGGKKELPMEARLLIAFVLMFLVLFLTPYLYKPAPGPKSTTNVTPQKAEQITKPPAPATPSPAAVPASTPAPSKAAGEAVQAAKEEPFTVDTALYRVTFSNKGAVVKSWLLKKYKDSDGKPLELVNTGALDKTPAPFSLDFKDRKPNYDANQVYYVGKPASDGLGIEYEYSDGQTTVRKQFTFGKNSYRAQVNSEVQGAGTTLPHYLVWRGGFGDPTIHNAPSVERTVYYNAAESRLFTKTARDAKSGPVTVSGAFNFAGLEDPYFTAVVLPNGSGSIELRTVADSLPYADKTDQFVGAEIGGEGANRFSLFVGPKDTDILKAVDPKLEQLIDWGRWFGFLAKPLFFALNWTNDTITHNFGWAIVLVTVALNMLTLPLRLSSMKSAKKMQALQPQIAAINAKYKNLSLRDPKQQDKNQEVMDLYKKHGVNPLGGCLPMVIQLPFFIAFYTVLTVAIELRGAGWLWVHDLSRPEQLAIRILPVILIATQFFMQKMTPASPGMDPAQQKMMMFMPLALGFMFYYQSAGLVLYWLTGNLVGIAQQWLTNKTVAAPKAVIDVSPVKKKTVRT
jgi:YidC/Oxa1 family membrane protein insertase